MALVVSRLLSPTDKADLMEGKGARHASSLGATRRSQRNKPMSKRARCSSGAFAGAAISLVGKQIGSAVDDDLGRRRAACRARFLTVSRAHATRSEGLGTGYLPLDFFSVDSGDGRELALQERSNAAEHDHVLTFDPHLKAVAGRSKNCAGVLESEELFGVGGVDRKAISAAFRAKPFGDGPGMRNRHECFSDMFVHGSNSQDFKAFRPRGPCPRAEQNGSHVCPCWFADRPDREGGRAVQPVAGLNLLSHDIDNAPY